MPQLPENKRSAIVRGRLLLCVYQLSVGASLLLSSAIANDPVSFEREVLPLLEHRCNECHHPEEMRGGLDLTRLPTILRGGDDEGPALVPGKPEESPMILMLTGKLKPRMPKKADPLPQKEIDLLSRWVSEGGIDDTPEFSDEDLTFFEKEVRPILFQRCFKCHAGEEAESGLVLSARYGIVNGGDHGPAAVSGKPEESLLIAAVKHEGRRKMPKGGDRLTDKEIAALEEWIRRGLPWPTNQKVLTRKKLFTISDADRNHWAFRELPKSQSQDWSIDSELKKRWAEQDIAAAPPAEPHQLLRRVSFDLIGYPPTPEEIASYLKDRETLGEDEAVAKVIDRLLATPQFGWRWGRHWIDYTRNGANGQPNRGPGFDAKHYQGWVADCFNQDRPWDWFARVHLAGDQMPGIDGRDYSIDQALAATIPLNGARTFQNAPTESFVLMDKIDEGIEFMGRSLMGVSMECARCHDHKFDPISQRDYYALLGYFQSSWFAPVPGNTKTRADAEKAIALHREMVNQRSRYSGLIRRESIKLNASGGGRTKKWQITQIPKLTKKDKRLRELELEVHRGELAQEKNASIAQDIKTAITDLEARLENHTSSEYSGFGSLSGYAYFIGGHKSQKGLIKRATEINRPKLVKELQAQADFWRIEREKWIERSRFGGYAKSDPVVAELAAADDRIAEINEAITINPKQPWLPIKETHRLVRADGGYRRIEDLAPFEEKALAEGLKFNGDNSERVWIHPYFIGDSRLLLRGDVLTPENLVPRTTPQFFGGGPAPSVGSGRLQLADWLTQTDSTQAALVARTVVNRAWQNLFGEGLCRTPKELGRLGETPELPEVIDGLSVKFIDSGWSVKSLLKEIVSSDTYRQNSATDPGAYKKDPQNRWFARQNVRRLQSEAVLNSLTWLRNEKRYVLPEDRDSNLLGAGEYAEHFDGPTTDELIERRTGSITPSQALFLMNHKSSTRNIAGAIQKRVSTGGNKDLLDLLPAIYEIVLQRPPTEGDIAVARNFIQSNPEATTGEYIHLLTCSNELIYID